MSYLAPFIIPALVDTWMSSKEFHAAIRELEPRLACHLLYIERYNSLIVAPLHWIASAKEAFEKAKKFDQPDPDRVDFQRKLLAEWISLITIGASEHPHRSKLHDGIQRALSGDKLPLPDWIEFFNESLTTGDDGRFHLPSKRKVMDMLGASSEPAADLLRVLRALDFAEVPREKRGRKSI